MENLKFILSITVCKILIFLGKLAGKKGSSTPGNIALKICPDILKKLSGQLKGKIICTLGTNGKTTTNNMTDLIIRSSGRKTVCNNVGANMLYGVVTAFAAASDIFGKIKAEYAVIEIDEASAKIVFRHLTPNYIILTNLFRDQLDRYGEIDITIEHLKKAIDMAPSAVLIINADDPLCKYLGEICENKVITYGISENVLTPLNETKEGRFCQLCGEELHYNYYHYSQLGDYICPKCGFKRGNPDFEATEVDCIGNVSFTLNGETRIKSSTYGFYNIYNMLASLAAVKTAGISVDNVSEVFSSYEPQIARMEEFKFGDKTVILNLSKNPAGFNQALSAMKNDQRSKSVVIAINDNAQDGYDISWLYDVDFEMLKGMCENYAVSGKRVYDMALRLFYADVCDKPMTDDEPVDLVMKLLSDKSEVIYLLVNYTVIFDAEKKLKKKHKEFMKKRGIKNERA